MRKIDNGGPAFPMPAYTYGMSLRDYFAGQAIAAAILESTRVGSSYGTWDAIATDAYHIADAMIAEKRRTEEGGDE